MQYEGTSAKVPAPPAPVAEYPKMLTMHGDRLRELRNRIGFLNERCGGAVPSGPKGIDALMEPGPLSGEIAAGFTALAHLEDEIEAGSDGYDAILIELASRFYEAGRLEGRREMMGPVLRTHGTNADCPDVQKGTAKRCPGHWSDALHRGSLR